MHTLTGLQIDEVIRMLSDHFGQSVLQVLEIEARGGWNHDVTVQFYGKTGSYAYHVDKMPGLGWVVVGMA